MSGHFSARADSPTMKRATRAYVECLMDEVLPDLRLTARGCGYALALHGSLARDIDLIAIPWAEQADDPDYLLDRLCGVLSGKLGRALREKAWTDKPHGRRACTIILPGMCPEIDFSVMPRIEKEGEQA